VQVSKFNYTVSLIDGKYTIMIMYYLSTCTAPLRFNVLRRCIGDIPFKTLSSTLKKMEEDGLIIRTEYPQIPPKVEYRLSERGTSLLPIIDMLLQWGEESMK
jgi:DNA-binding HxlR family transcriptional regulator